MPRLPFKANQDRRHRIPKQRHRVTNWPACDAGLRARGSLTVWFTAGAIEGWKAGPRTGRGGQPRYSSSAITTALIVRAVFRLALRQTEGLIASIPQLPGLDLAVPDHSTLGRRAGTLEVPRLKAGSEPARLLADSTGLRLCGPGEWLAEKHGTGRRRSWRELHPATDADTGHIVASELAGKDADDGSMLSWRPSPAMVHSTGTTSTPRSPRAIPMRPSSCRHARARCRVAPTRPRRRSGMRIYDASPSAGAWAGRRRRGTTGALWQRPT
jgi:hypothetical protein